MKFFENRIFFKYSNFSPLWDKEDWTKKSDMPCLCINFFETPIFLKHWMVPPRSFRHFETKNNRRKNGIPNPPPPPPVAHKLLSTPENFWNTEGTTYKIFLSSKTKKFPQKQDSFRLLCMKFFETIFLKHRRVPERFFSALWDKRFPTKSNTPHLFFILFFPTVEFFWNVEGLRHKFFRHCETKTVWMEEADNPTSVIHKLLSIRENLWNTEGTHYEAFRSCETKKFRQIFVAPPPPASMHENFRYQNSLERHIFETLWGKKHSM